MRRKDREVLDETKIDEFIRNCDCCRVGFYDKENDEVYIVPWILDTLNVNNKEFLFHGAKKEEKLIWFQRVAKLHLKWIVIMSL